ncbi:PTS system transporter subunit IIA [Xenorhabdus szentirmaii]|nr:PTS system transporter subunit IIA [Xenorhabdus szentirmaii]
MIGTHGAAAEQLLRTAEMLIGEQENVSYIDFVPGENADTLFDKYNEKLTSLDTNQGVLFFVDTWGGSPFNAANRIAIDKDNYEIITGVNVPMLVEAFMCRDDDPSMAELVSVALETGREGIRALKTAPEEEPAKPEPAKPAAPVPTSAEGGHMKIALARIDDRLIHGQVATRWTKETNVKRIIVVSDAVAQDTVRSTLLKQVAPRGSVHMLLMLTSVSVFTTTLNMPVSASCCYSPTRLTFCASLKVVCPSNLSISVAWLSAKGKLRSTMPFPLIMMTSKLSKN